MRKPKLIYIYPSKSSFINSDIEFLSKKFEVEVLDLPWGNAKKLLINLGKQFMFLLRYTRKTETIVISFAGYFSLLPVVFGKIFKKKTLIILNGTDCVSFPEYNYGSLRKPLLRFFIEKSQHYASKLLPVDASLIQQKHLFDKNVAQKNQGLKAFFKKNTTPTTVIPNGFNTDFWNFSSENTKKNGFITVVATQKKATAIFKGIDLVIAIAKKNPQKNFTIVGMSKEIQQAFEVLENVTYYPFVLKETLRTFYQEHQFYMQLSINEGFGCALAEAMLCGCIPIVANTGALPTVVGKTGFIVEKRTNSAVESVVKEALQTSEEKEKELSLRARSHIVNNFSISKRERLLLQEINS